MKLLSIALAAALLAAPLAARPQGDETELTAPQPALDPHAGHHTEQPSDPHARHDMDAAPDAPSPSRPPAAAFSGPAHAADQLFDTREMAAAREQLRLEQGGLTAYRLLVDRFEAGFGEGDNRDHWGAQGWYGGDVNRFWVKGEGNGDLGDGAESTELQVLYSRAISPFFNLQAGVRRDFNPDPARSYLVLGLHGLSPWYFEVDAAVFLSDEGDMTGRLETALDVHVTQRMILQPRIEMNIAAQDVPELEVGSGLAEIEAALRLRYEIRRELAPYIGIGWERKLKATRDFARAGGEADRGWAIVAGLRFWF